MHHVTRSAAAAVFLCVLGACGGKTGQQAAMSDLSSNEQSWTGNIRAREQRSGQVGPTSPSANYQGTVRLTRVEGDISRTNVYIMLSGPPPQTSDGISWVLASGRCGAIEAPVLPVSAFDPLDVGSNGRGEKSLTIPFEFPTTGSYHVDFFSGHSARLTDVIACADLRIKS
jgi:hypothetical protein